MGKKKFFDFAIGNPPYQQDMADTSDKPVYDKMMDVANAIACKVELITPARFLFNAGKTNKDWNEKMLKSSHFKVLSYEKDSMKIFPGLGKPIRGGVAITYHDYQAKFHPIEIFLADKELNGVLHKVMNRNDFNSMSNIVFSPESYKFTKLLYDEHPEIHSMTYQYKNKVGPLISKGHDYDLTSNIFDKLDGIVFFVDKPKDNENYIEIIGRKANTRCKRYIKRKYIANHENLNAYKILFPKSNGSGTFGESLTLPLVAYPGEGHTQTFISIGKLNSEEEAQNEVKYIKTKFARALLGILKVTQDNKKGVWKYVPLQDFSVHSDIDWTKSIHEIDLQLYKKYGLSSDEIDFIESHVKEMK